MEKPYVKPTLDKVEWKLNDVILYSVPQETEPYEVVIKRIMKQELIEPDLPEETEPPTP